MKVPWLLGSGQEGAPWLRMHRAKARAFWTTVDPPVLDELGGPVAVHAVGSTAAAIMVAARTSIRHRQPRPSPVRMCSPVT